MRLKEGPLDPVYDKALFMVVDHAKGDDVYPDAYAVVVWIGESGSTYTWPQGVKDNRISRVLARIERYNMEEPVVGGLVIIKKKRAA